MMHTHYCSLRLLMRANEAGFRVLDLCDNICTYVHERGWDWWNQAIAVAQSEARRLDVAARVGHE